MRSPVVLTIAAPQPHLLTAGTLRRPSHGACKARELGENNVGGGDVVATDVGAAAGEAAAGEAVAGEATDPAAAEVTDGGTDVEA